MESNVRHGAMPGDAGGCQNYSGMLWGRGLVLSLSFLVKNLWVIVALGGFSRTSRAPGAAQELKPTFGQKRGCLRWGFALITGVSTHARSFGRIIGFKASVCFLSLILLGDIKLKPSS